MTPYEIRLLLWYYVSPTEAPGGEPLRAKAQFIDLGLLAVCDENESGVSATDRLKAYADALCAMPLPVQRWVMPDD